MRVFHFLKAGHGLDDIRQRRLKISLISDLNDPFELLSFALPSKELRKGMQEAKRDIARNTGILCFSKAWSNPILWSHYAERHYGLCLGFEVPSEKLLPVYYSPKRLRGEVKVIRKGGTSKENAAQRFLATKYVHWRYEEEMRCFVTLEDKEPDGDRYFATFSEDLRLAEVIVGARSEVSRSEVAEALGPLRKNVAAFKARLAFNSFKIVPNKKESLWG